MSFSLVGLASGLDTASIVSQLIELERLPIKNLETQKSSLQQKQNVLRSINTKLSTLKDLAAELKLASLYQTAKASVSDETVLKASASGSAAAGTYTIEVLQKATQHVVAAVSQAKDGLVTGVTDGATFQVNGKVITVKADISTTWQTLYTDLADKINKAGAGVRASVVETTPGNIQLVLTSENAGAANKINITGSELTFNEVQTAQDAIIKVNGLTVQRSGNKLDDVIPGLTIELLKNSGSVSVEVARNSDKIADKIEQFVKAYNDVVNTIRNNIGKKQILQGDSTLRMLDNRLQSVLYTAYSANPGDYRFLHQIGLEIDKGITSGSTMTGTIQFDEELFLEKLEENPDAVINLLTDKDNGIMALLEEELATWTSSSNGILTNKINGFSEEIQLVDERVAQMEERLLRKEEQLKKQFAAMEVALAQLQNQQQWISAQLSALTSLNSSSTKK